MVTTEPWLIKVIRYLVLSLAVVELGGLGHFIRLSFQWLLYVFEASLGGGAAVVLAHQWRQRISFPAWPWLVWIGVFFGWGLTVSPKPDAVLHMVVSALVVNVLIVLSLSALTASLDSMRALCTGLFVAALGNAVFIVWELGHPDVVAALALSINPLTTAFATDRPAGLWAEPNEAAIGLLLALMLSKWVRGPRPLMWFARLFLLVAIVLTGSRGGLLTAIVAIVVLAALDLRSMSLNGELALALSTLTLAAAIPLVVVIMPELQAQLAFLSQSAQPWDRLLAINDAVFGSGVGSRLDLARAWLTVAVNGPIQGSGAFSFEGTGGADQGAHNVFIAVWGEAGAASLVLFLALCVYGCLKVIRKSFADGSDKVLLLAFWTLYIAQGFAFHNQFDSSVLIGFGVLLFVLPRAFGDRPDRLREGANLQVGGLVRDLPQGRLARDLPLRVMVEHKGADA